MSTPKMPLQQDEILFLKNNFYNLTNLELTNHINNSRAVKNQYTVSGLRHKCTKLGLSRGIQIRWSKSDVKKLKAWYRIIGDTLISELLNKFGNSKKKINGKIIKRVFTKKHVEKKRRLLGLSRTLEQISEIRKDNKLCGHLKDFTSKDNLWTRGVSIKAKDQEVRIWKDVRVIKINGKFIPYTRWYYNNFIEKVPDNLIVFHIDMDRLNDDPKNLEVRKKRKLNSNDYSDAVKLLEPRLLILKTDSSSRWDLGLPEERKEMMAEIIRIENIISKLKSRHKKEIIKDSGYYEHIEAF